MTDQFKIIQSYPASAYAKKKVISEYPMHTRHSIDRKLGRTRDPSWILERSSLTRTRRTPR